MKATKTNALKLMRQINTKYDELDGEDGGFFDLYHDDLLIQRDCSFQEYEEIIEYLDNPKKMYGRISGKEGAEIGIKNLHDTLIYMTAVIDIQTKINDLPKSIYG